MAQERFHLCCCHQECGFWCTTITILLVFFALAALLVHEIAEAPHYSIAINSVAGLDPSKDLGDPTLHPEFNLTLGVASRALTGRQCVEDGTVVEVSYRGVLLASSGPAKELCAEARTYEEQPVFAFAGDDGVRLPGFVHDGLAVDVRRGVQV